MKCEMQKKRGKRKWARAAGSAVDRATPGDSTRRWERAEIGRFRWKCVNNQVNTIKMEDFAFGEISSKVDRGRNGEKTVSDDGVFLAWASEPRLSNLACGDCVHQTYIDVWARYMMHL